ncbi:hypothetical protein CK203_017697 [Vitis vinifera]|uniref:Uncharacterized protein n=1 Tax=Vitis vinifera TaxID=29760 RepID=A0A438JGW3_VITVI|nr:hypothetical protein CK203_017697 [Vitis vinifera]
MTTEIIDVEDAGIWRGNIEKILINIMVKEVNKDNMDSGTFSTTHGEGSYLSNRFLHYSSTQDPPNTDDEDAMDDNLEHGGVHVDVDIEILDDPLQPEMVRGVTTHSGKCATDSLLERRGKKESRLSQMGDALKAWAETSKTRTETSRARTKALLARVERYKSGTSSEATSAG